VVAGAVRENVASVKTLQKLGFMLEGTFRQEFFLDGVFHDILHFGLLSHELRSA
jgi:RimJ/RimL family protein N-acetyltransferase